MRELTPSDRVCVLVRANGERPATRAERRAQAVARAVSSALAASVSIVLPCEKTSRLRPGGARQPAHVLTERAATLSDEPAREARHARLTRWTHEVAHQAAQLGQVAHDVVDHERRALGRTHLEESFALFAAVEMGQGSRSGRSAPPRSSGRRARSARPSSWSRAVRRPWPPDSDPSRCARPGGENPFGTTMYEGRPERLELLHRVGLERDGVVNEERAVGHARDAHPALELAARHGAFDAPEVLGKLLDGVVRQHRPSRETRHGRILLPLSERGKL